MILILILRFQSGWRAKVGSKNPEHFIGGSILLSKGGPVQMSVKERRIIGPIRWVEWCYGVKDVRDGQFKEFFWAESNGKGIERPRAHAAKPCFSNFLWLPGFFSPFPQSPLTGLMV